MQKWGERERDFANVLAVWPIYEPVSDKWYLHELYENDEFPPQWRSRQIKGPFGYPQGEAYRNREEAFTVVLTLNEQLRQTLAFRNIPETKKHSLQLKVEKALIARNRLMQEEELMFVAAKSKNTDLKVDSSKIKFESGRRFDDLEIDKFRLELLNELADLPYLRAVLIRKSISSKYGTFKLNEDTWSRPFYVNKQMGLRIWRARIADGFGLDSNEHWGRTKARIREMLLPDATKLLLRRDVKAMLDEALGRGEQVLVCSGFIFWYEPDGDIGWQVKITSTDSSDDGRTIWHEGKILSKNYGRIVVLPYIKENGEPVMGHTKNIAHDGPAMPRQKKNYLEIPFTEMSGDLMIGLLGEIYRKDFVNRKS